MKSERYPEVNKAPGLILLVIVVVPKSAKAQHSNHALLLGAALAWYRIGKLHHSE